MNNTNTQIPNSPQELLKKNQEPLSPEVIWEEFGKMSVKEQEIFIWNCVDKMGNFHEFVVNKMMNDDDYDKEDVGVWIQDGTKWREIKRILNGMLGD